MRYGGFSINEYPAVTGGGYWVSYGNVPMGPKRFTSVEAAKAWIDEQNR